MSLSGPRKQIGELLKCADNDFLAAVSAGGCALSAPGGAVSTNKRFSTSDFALGSSTNKFIVNAFPHQRSLRDQGTGNDLPHRPYLASGPDPPLNTVSPPLLRPDGHELLPGLPRMGPNTNGSWDD